MLNEKQHEIFNRIHDTMAPGGILVTASTELLVRQALTSAGFSLELIDLPLSAGQVLRAVRK